ncbi:flagellar hook-associated protein FlgK [Niallia circulans]|uniref:flagellar hook-associated protein FlgK n=1 Tax=Niallia circulans TaxID=1397 RepID=UPI002E1C54EF|nr:flagellar hook-associated protein FlgK [Niallia circulans]MED5098976.1 flagellar hook-associated protein FlgK [Niallia circulans]
MVSTFMGLETAKRALTTQQSAIATAGHNIANANTLGYTRQRVSLAATQGYPAVGQNSPVMPGHLGTGVQADQIERIRDSFVDMQYRKESSKLGYWDSKAQMLSQMENVMDELSGTGISNSMDQFWNSLQDLATEPENEGARRVVRERGSALADTFKYMYTSLKAIQKDNRNELENTEDNINSVLKQINQLNQQIGAVEPNGYLPNDLYDERDRLLDSLSTMMNIKVEAKSSGGLARASAEGLYDVYMATPEGDILTDSNGQPIKLIDASTRTANGIHIQYDSREELDSPVTSFKFCKLNDDPTAKSKFEGIETDSDADAANGVYTLNDFKALNSQGKLKGVIEGYGYMEGGEIKGTYNAMFDDLDEMVYTFATAFNEVHRSGYSLNEIEDGTARDIDFFSFTDSNITADNPKGAAGSIVLSKEILEDVDNIAAATESSAGNGTNALNLAKVKDSILDFGGNKTNVQAFYQGVIGKLGEQASEANRMEKTSGILKNSVEQTRMSVSGVSIDEEMVDLIKYQQAYNSAARMITIVDEMLDKVINGMGVGGR